MQSEIKADQNEFVPECMPPQIVRYDSYLLWYNWSYLVRPFIEFLFNNESLNILLFSFPKHVVAGVSFTIVNLTQKDVMIELIW